MQRAPFNQQRQNIDKVYKRTVVKAQCSIGIEENPDARINCNYAIDNIGKHMEKLWLLLEIQLKIIFYNHVLHKKLWYLSMSIQKRVHLTKIHKFLTVVDTKISLLLNLQRWGLISDHLLKWQQIFGYPLLLTDKVLSIRSDGRQQFDLF